MTTVVKDHPILFTGEMVRAILDGRKTQTRRIVKPQPEHGPFPCPHVASGWAEAADTKMGSPVGCTCREMRSPYGVPGDRLYVRENARLEYDGHDYSVRYQADHHAETMIGEIDPVTLSWIEGARWVPDTGASVTPWRPSILVPKSLSRIRPEVTDVRVERVQEITNEDALAEGVNGSGPPHAMVPYEEFAKLWDSINGERAPWGANPWVWVVTFREAHTEARHAEPSPLRMPAHDRPLHREAGR